ncbi:MAG: hypothetical protein LRZ85_06640 [Alphaproteobacteria bacterium]|nr:hypothetical protein [Alphaproteobacteria bacterium]
MSTHSEIKAVLLPPETKAPTAPAANIAAPLPAPVLSTPQTPTPLDNLLQSFIKTPVALPQTGVITAHLPPPVINFIQPEVTAERPVLPLPSGQSATIILPPGTETQPSAPQLLELVKTTLLPTLPSQTTLPTLSLQVASLQTPPPLFTAPETDTKPSPAFAFTPPVTEGAAKLFTPKLSILSGKAETAPDKIIAKVSGILPKQDLPVVTLSMITAPSAPTEIPPLYILHTPALSLLPGAELILTPETSVSVPGTTSAASLSAPPSIQSLTTTFLPPYPYPALAPGVWPVMDEIYQNLALAAPQAAQSLINMTPSPASPGQIAPAALFFVAAIRSGDLQSWLGDKALETLKSTGKGGLLSRLTQEGGLLNRLSSEPVSQDWRALPLPMAWQNEIQKTSIYFRHEEDDSADEAKGSKGTRFIMDLSLTRLGPVQLDGLFRDKGFDVILRTAEPFTAAARQTMRALFHGALEVEGLTGDLSFQNKPGQWVRISGGKETF